MFLYSGDAMLLNYVLSVLKSIDCPCCRSVMNFNFDKMLEGFINDYLVNTEDLCYIAKILRSYFKYAKTNEFLFI